jgi:pimeloyl-ACP methyl ester carboxylesterase
MQVLRSQSESSEKFAFTPLYWQWNGHQIGYTIQGTGQPLILVHGFGASIGHWRKNLPVLAAQGYRVYALDLLGFGSSDKPALNYSLELWEALLNDFWAAHIQKPTVWIGNSIGALLVQMMLANHPETARGGVLINAAGGLNHRPEELNVPLRLIMGTFTKLVTSPVIGEFIFNRIRQKTRLRTTLRQIYRNPEAITDELIEILHRPSCDPGAQKVFASILSAPPGPSPQELLPRIQQPLLVLWGDADPWTPITGAKVYRSHQEQGNSLQLTPIVNAGHCPHDEYPEIVNPLILSWLAETNASLE